MWCGNSVNIQGFLFLVAIIEAKTFVVAEILPLSGSVSQSAVVLKL